jgi:superfamily II DNA helicase RecQ
MPTHPTKFQPEIVYSHYELIGHLPHPQIEYLDGNGQPQNIFEYITQILHGSGQGSRALIFCQTVIETEFMAQTMGCESYHMKMSKEARMKVLKNWEEGRHNILSTTSALVAGYQHPPSVVLVVHYGTPQNHVDYVQGFGRGARINMQGCRYCTVFSKPTSKTSMPVCRILLLLLCLLRSHVRRHLQIHCQQRA